MATTSFKSNEDDLIMALMQGPKSSDIMLYFARLIYESMKEEELDACIRKLFLCENQVMNICILLAHKEFRAKVI
jgi:hypothetical protein